MTSAPLHQARIWRGPIEGVHAEELHSARSFGRHWHDDYGFGVMEAGGHRSASARGMVEALPGNIVTSNPGEVHDGHPLERMPRRWRMVHVSRAAMTRLVDEDDREFTQAVFNDPGIHSSMKRLFALWNDMNVQTSAISVATCEEALTHTCGLLRSYHSNRRLGLAAPARLTRVRDCLLDMYSAPSNLDELARLAGLSRFQLVRQFARWQGLPPFAWLQQQRLRMARQMIALGTPLADAAAANGFADQSHMHRQFVRSFGFTPGQWRRLTRGHLQ